MARPKKKRPVTTRPGKGRWRAPDLVKRDLPADRLNQNASGPQGAAGKQSMRII
jgi:hypothetical protein